MTEDGNKPKDIFELIDRQFKELPIHKRFQKLENLIDEEVNDALSDLTEEEINIIAIYMAFNRYLDGQLKVLDYLLTKKMSLMRSRDRLGRQEYLQGLKDSKEVYVPYQPIPHASEVEDKIEEKKKGGLVQALRSFFGRRRR